MAPRLSNDKFNYWLELLAKINEGHAKSGVPLRDDLQTSLVAATETFTKLVNEYKALRAREKQLRRDAARAQTAGRETLDRVRNALISQVPRGQIEAVLQAYDLDRRRPHNREDVLSSLRLAREAVQRQTQEIKKPSAALQAQLEEAHTTLREKMNAIQATRSDIEETSRALQAALADNAELRERIFAYLISVLPAARQDPKLMDYGLREHFRSRARSKVAVVEEVPEPAPYPGTAPAQG